MVIHDPQKTGVLGRGSSIELTLIVVHLMGMIAVESIVKLHNVGVRGISHEGISSAIKAENESVRCSLGRIHFLIAWMYFMRVSRGIGGKVAIDAVGLRARVSHSGIRAVKGRRSNKDKGRGLQEWRAAYRMSRSSTNEVAFCNERSKLRLKMCKEHKESCMRSNQDREGKREAISMRLPHL